MSQIPPTIGSQAAPVPTPPPPPPPQPPASGAAALSAEAKQKIAAIYAAAQTAHTPAAQVQEQIDAVIAQSPPAAPPSSSEDQINLFDASA